MAVGPVVVGGSACDYVRTIVGARFLVRDPLESVTRSPNGYVANNPLNATDPTGLFSIPSIGGFWHGFTTMAGCAFEWLVADVQRGIDSIVLHRSGLLKIASVAFGVAAIAVTAPLASVALGLTGVFLSAAAEASSDAPCKAQRIAQAFAVGGVFATISLVWTGAGQLADAAGDLSAATIAERAGQGLGIGDIGSVWLPNLRCDQ